MLQTQPSILLVEDDFADALLIRKKILETWGDAKITQVEYLGEAYEECRQNEFDLIVLDLNLPDGYGPRSVSQIRSFEKSTPITVVTGIKTPVTERDSKRYGANTVMQKSDFFKSSLHDTLGLYIAS